MPIKILIFYDTGLLLFVWEKKIKLIKMRQRDWQSERVGDQQKMHTSKKIKKTNKKQKYIYINKDKK